MTTLSLAGIGVVAPGLPDWDTARVVLSARATFDPALSRALASHLPGTERRRASETSRWSIAAALEAVRDLAQERVATLPTVFASADGDGGVLDATLISLAESRVSLSPTLFHNSVFNAPAGYWSIGARAHAESTSICAGEGTFAAALLECAALVDATGEPALLVACDLPIPMRVPFDCPRAAAFACALLFEPARANSRWGQIDGPAVTTASGSRASNDAAIPATFAGNASSAALLLLQAVAGERARVVTLPYIGDTVVDVSWRP